MNVAMEFLHDGRPIRQQRSLKPAPKVTNAPLPRNGEKNIHRDVLALLARPNIGSFAFIAEQYDHEVQGTSVTKPLQGRGRVNAEAAVLRPLQGRDRGIVLAHGYCPSYSEINAYAMAAAALDTAVRGAICAGASLEHLSLLDNFCWSSGNTPERLYQLKEAARACYEGAVTYGTPFISGKDSMFNDFKGYTQKGEPIHIAALPTVLVSALGVLRNVTQAITLDLKQPYSRLYLLGETHDELGGSEYLAYRSEKSGTHYFETQVPQTNFGKNKNLYAALAAANRRGLVAAALGVSRGGLMVTLAKMAIAGQLGLSVETPALGSASSLEAVLFSESQGRIVAEVSADKATQFERLMTQKRVKHQRLGEAMNKPSVELLDKNSRPTESFTVAELAKAYASAFKNF